MYSELSYCKSHNWGIPLGIWYYYKFLDMYKSTGLRSQIWLSMYSASAMLVMLYAINSVMDSEWSEWVALQCSVVTCLYHYLKKTVSLSSF